MVVEDFNELKRKKERGMTNAEFLEKCSKTLKDHEKIVITAMDKDGYISTYYTHSTSLSALGMMEVAKVQLISEMEV